MHAHRKKSSQVSILSYVYERQETSKAAAPWQVAGKLFERCKGLHKRDLISHYGCVNAIEFSHNGGELLASGGDDKRVLLWNVEQAISNFGTPVVMKGEHHSNIFCLAFDGSNKKIFSSGNDEQVILHDIERGETLDVFLHDDTVYGLAVDPNNDNVYASACDDGRVLIWDIRESRQDPFLLANYSSPFHSVVYNPVEPRFLATANSNEGVGLWDIRAPGSCLMRYGGSITQQSAMSVKFNCRGDRILALRRRLPPVLYEIQSRTPLFQFDHSGYYNSCTMKSCCFAGDRDQYALSGSDDFNLYVWKIPDETLEIPWVSEAHMVLKGHRSIVNQVRFNPANHTIASSGVEKVIKIWSPFTLPGGVGNQDPDEVERSMYSHEEYIDLVLNSGQGLSHDYTNQSTQEDSRMIAFFDSLLQREVEGWSSLSDSDDSLMSEEGFFVHLMDRERSDAADRSSDSGSSRSDDSDITPDSLNIQIDSRSTSQGIAELSRLFSVGGRRQQQNQNSHASSNTGSESQSCVDIPSLGILSSAPSGPDCNHTSSSSSSATLRRRGNVLVSEDRDSSSDSDQECKGNQSRKTSEISPPNQRQSNQSDSDDSGSSRGLPSMPSSLDYNHLISLRQRIACRRALREKMNRNSTRNQESNDEDASRRIDVATSQNRPATSHMRSIQVLRHRIYQEDGEGSDVVNASDSVPTASGAARDDCEAGGSERNCPSERTGPPAGVGKASASEGDSSTSPERSKKGDSGQGDSSVRKRKAQETTEGVSSRTCLARPSDCVNKPNTITGQSSTTNPPSVAASAAANMPCPSASGMSSNGDVTSSSTTSHENHSGDANSQNFRRFKNHAARSKRRNYRKTSPSRDDAADSDE